MTRYRSDDDWVFASKKTKGKRPIWGQSIIRKQIHPAVQKIGIEKRIGWHTFRHSYSTLLRYLGTDISILPVIPGLCLSRGTDVHESRLSLIWMARTRTFTAPQSKVSCASWPGLTAQTSVGCEIFPTRNPLRVSENRNVARATVPSRNVQFHLLTPSFVFRFGRRPLAG
jgi:Phage integrase family